MAELDAAHSEARNYSNERFRLKSALDESNEQLDIVRRENKNLADEIKDLLDQLGDGGRSIHELDKQRRRMESEKEELQSGLEAGRGLPRSRREQGAEGPAGAWPSEAGD